MTCTQQLADSARRAQRVVTEDGLKRVIDFVLAQQKPDGGFRGRTDAGDLYYTYFAARVLDAGGAGPLALSASDFLLGCDPDRLDFVHLACLACLLADVGHGTSDGRILDRIETFRAANGGYAEKQGAAAATAYGTFLAVLAYETQTEPVPDGAALARAVQSLAPNVTTAVAAQVILMTSLGIAPPDPVGDALLARVARGGGFRAAPLAPLPDLLSTATALCALRALGRPLDVIREKMLYFVESLWDDSGGFVGHALDPTPDCEYTYYALLALGALA